jgi:hypothetical protein
VADPTPFYPYDQAAALVTAQIEMLNARADSTLEVANDAIDALSNVDLPGEGTAPEYTLEQVRAPTIVEPAPPATNLFGEIDDITEPLFEDFQNLLSSLDLLAIPTYTPPITTLDIPPPPAPIDTSGAPDRPTLNDVTVPDDPNVAIPGPPDEIQINVPARPVIVLPTFEDEPVTFDTPNVNTVMQWDEPTYHSDTLDAIKATIQRWLAGGTGMTPEVETALFDRARDKLDTSAMKRVQEAFDTFAAKGWAMPPGMLAEQVNIAQQEAQQMAADLATDILTKSAEWEQENLRQAVSQGIALEGVLIQQFENVAKRVFDAARARLDADVQMFGAYVSLYNARQAGRQILVAIFEAKLKAALAPLDVMKAELEAEQLKGQLNETRARIYATKMEAVRAIVSIFEAKVNAARVKSEVERNKIDAFKADVEAFAAILSARKTAFEAYEAQMRGEGVKGQIVESYARAFAATVDGINGSNNSKINFVRAKIEALTAGVQKYTARLTAQRDRIAAQSEAVRARASSYTADVQRFSAELGMNTELARLVQQLAELRLRNNLAYYEVKQKAYDAAMARTIQRAEIAEHGLAAAGSMASQLAAGAMSAGHVQASLSGSGSASASNSASWNYQYNYDAE